MLPMLKQSFAAFALAAAFSIIAGSVWADSLDPSVVEQVLETGGWSLTADDTNQREQLTVDLVKRIVKDYPTDTRTIGLLTLTLGAAKWGVRDGATLPTDPANDNWRGPTRASGKHLMSYKIGGVGIPHLDVAPLAKFIDYLLTKHSEIGGTADQQYMSNLAHRLRTGTKYDQVKANAIFRKWMLEGLRHKDAQEWILNYWLDTYWVPAYAASGGDVRLALVLARIWNTRPQLGACAASQALKSKDHVQAALQAYVDCPGGRRAYEARRWGWMKRPVVLYDTYANKPAKTRK
ncbi:hypothetical protein [Rhizobium leguminosarum]|uniref:hypothetical protein n=1 Tax=Rhizobium leguminosarum TaxID=384 RepID=UPI001F3593DE|nr:hypothetical protein [Rhizobium leguminosarum]UIJ83153.1 hypothetical protein LZK78_32235 [Rhizobium leguminosarum]